jgi:hypothetical protein
LYFELSLRNSGTASYSGGPAHVFRLSPAETGLVSSKRVVVTRKTDCRKGIGCIIRQVASVFLKRVRFVRDYVLDGNRARVRRLILLSAHALIVGTVEMTVWFGNQLSRQAWPAGESTEPDATIRPLH